MQKIIHYCWFGGKPLPKMAKKCIRSWKKNFPDYEIKEWNETNFDVNICPFVKGAYAAKKWAFVSDYARLYALYNYGGIYFDTDMEILKKCDFLLSNDVFMGYEENKVIAAGVIGVKNSNNKYIKELLDWYDNKFSFDENNLFEYAIPRVITNVLSKYSKEILNNEIEIIDNSLYIYPEDYFYPINYNYSKKVYSNNTCMVHYYDATWAPKGEKVANFFIRIFGNKIGKILLKFLYFLCEVKNHLLRIIKKFIYLFAKAYDVYINLNKRVNISNNILDSYKNSNYIVIYHPDWIGLSHVAKDNFKYILPLKELYTKKEANLIAKLIFESNKKLIIFNGFAKGWEYIAKELKNLDNNIIIKVLWHGSHALLSEYYDWVAFNNIITLYNNKVINEIGFIKKSMYDFYKLKKYNVSFFMNDIFINEVEKYKQKSDALSKKVKIGLYSSGDRWVKNTYNQLSAVSLIENCVLDCIPLNTKIRELANIFNIELTGTETSISRDNLFQRISQNDINLYVTFTECAPLLPLESLELGVPCITGDNHHYFEGTELEKYLVVTKEDNIIEIYNKINYALANRETILSLYKEWKKRYDIEAKKSIEDFIKI